MCQKNYYDDLLERVGEIDEDVEVLKQHGILIDRDDEGYLFTVIYEARFGQTNHVLRNHSA